MRLFFCTDIHGSDRCWRKFLGAAGFYEADVIALGGDITGKFLVPVVQLKPNRWSARFLGVERKLKSRNDVDRLLGQIANAGGYGFELTPDELAELQARPEKMDEQFKRLVLQRVEDWVALARERFGGTATRVLVCPGNDDFVEIDAILKASEVVEFAEGSVVALADGVELLGIGLANLTPWNCPRDVPETVICDRIDALAGTVTAMEKAVFMIHVPPFDSNLDVAPKLDAALRVVKSAGGQTELIPVGSTAVRAAIERYQPALGLHGHIHESPRVSRLGDTTVVNPGSEYGEAILRGAVIDFSHGELEHVELTVG
jgi:Icc-related predicted phosphoesterase